ncbi:hypothetical protein [Actinomadura rubrisoli]|uniref:Uncharacterized protein n=1 Tax=Actinomadura rubrisoli TaxID=2530368 RepID=A0A4R5CCF9_9ACTN|nr:hypothetical protein [Actinomadura rubrisoli]TDD97678.1 hypothetical protein E1298_01185 [Actinomadura rubrisoli]
MPTFVKVTPDVGDLREEEQTGSADLREESGEDEWRPESVGVRVQRSLYATVWRCRRPLLPHLLAGSVLGAGVAAEAISAVGAVSPAGMSGILAGISVPLALLTSKRARRHRRRLGRRVLLGGLFGAGWLTVAPYGVATSDIAALAAVEYGLAARWWQHIRLGYPPPEEAPEAVHQEEPINRATRIIDDWDAFIGCPGGPLANSKLTLPKPTQYGHEFLGQLDRGKQTLENVVAALPKIATGLEEEFEHLIAESAPPDPVTGKKYPSRFRLQVIEHSPITGAVNFDGPRRENGLIGLGPWADGSGEAKSRLYTSGSMWSMAIIGDTGSGKSRVAENKVISALSGGDTVFWYLDPQGGGSSPALAEHADWFGTMVNAEDMLFAAVEILKARGEENSYEGLTGFTPSPQRPGLLFVVEECHNPFSVKAWKPWWAKIAREGRKVGIAFICLSQYPGLETFGNSEALRMNIMAGNAIALHVSSKTAGSLMPGLDVDPRHLPDIPGYGYIQGTPQTGTRTAPFRNRNTTPGESSEVARGWLATQPSVALDTLAATATLAAGTAYRDRHESSTAGRVASAARIEQLRSGILPDDMRTPQPAPDTTAQGEMGEVIEFPRALIPADLENIAPASPRRGLPELAGSRLAIVNAVHAGATRPVEIEAATGLKHRQVADLLKELVEAGYLTRPRTGRYRCAA